MQNIIDPTDTKSLASKTLHRKLSTLNMMDATIRGIPCLIEVPTRLSVDTEFQVYDRRGYKADWLAKKITSTDVKAIQASMAKIQSAYFD